MYLRARTIIFLFVIFSALFVTFYVNIAVDQENDEWIDTHEVWEDVVFRMGEDSYAYTTIYNPAEDNDGGDEQNDDVLRAYLSVEGARISFSHLSAIRIGDVTYHSGDMLHGLISGETTDVAFIGAHDKVVATYPIRFYIASGVASLYVQLLDKDIDEIADDKTTEANIRYESVNVDGSVDQGGTGQIHARGNHNWQFDKKSYSINLDNAVSLLGMEASSRWALRGTPEDYTMMMDRLVLDISKEIAIPHAVDAEYVNVYIDGVYKGLYNLAQRVKTDGGSVDLDDGYLMEFEMSDRYATADQGFKTEHRNVVVHSPEELSEEEMNSLAAYVQEAEDAVYNAYGINVETGKTWFEYLDATSWIQEFLIQEFCINYDADYTSTYLTKKTDDPLLYAGPCWDFDGTFWRTYYNGDYQSNLLNVRGRIPESWLLHLAAKADYHDALARYYLSVFEPTVRRIENELQTYVNQIGPSLLMMYDLYGIDFLDQSYVDSIASRFGDWFDARLDFLSDFTSNPESYAVLYFVFPENEKHNLVFAVKKGEPVVFNEPLFGHEEFVYGDGEQFVNGDSFMEDTILTPTDYADEEDEYGYSS